MHQFWIICYSHQPPSETPPLNDTNQFPYLNSTLLPSDFLYSFNMHSNAKAYQLLALSSDLNIGDCLNNASKMVIKCHLAKYCLFKGIFLLELITHPLLAFKYHLNHVLTLL